VSVLKVRKRERHRLKKTLSETEYKEIVKGMMWIIRKNSRDLPHPKWDLPADERKKLRRLLEYSPKLKLAYTFREELTAIFEMRLTKEEAKKRLLKWVDKVSRLSPQKTQISRNNEPASQRILSAFWFCELVAGCL